METATLEKPEETVADAPLTDADAKECPQSQDFALEHITDKHVLRLFYQPEGTLRLTMDKNGDGWKNYSYPSVKLYQAAPLSAPGRYIVLQDSRNEEIAMADDLTDFTPESREVAKDELRRRYLTAKVKAITHLKIEFGISYWNVDTDKGPRDFVVQSLSESCVWLSDSHIMLIDVDGNRFEIENRYALDEESLKRLALAL